MSSRQVKDIRLLSQTIFFFPRKPLAAVLSQYGDFLYTPNSKEKTTCCKGRNTTIAHAARVWTLCNGTLQLLSSRGSVHFSTLRTQTGLWKVLSDKNEGEVQLLALGQGSMMLFVLKSWWTILWTSWGFPAGSGARHPSWDHPEPPALTWLADKLDT